MDRLVLFDIDGTLLSTSGAAARAFRRALESVFGTSGPRSGYSFAGRTDPRIARDLLRLAGVDGTTVEARLPEVWPRYEAELERELAVTTVEVFPGVPDLLDRLDARSDVVLGLLTGNVRAGARLKLHAAGIGMERFAVGAFGSDHADRPELPAVAAARAEARYGRRFTGKSVVIVGDTPHDVSCGEHLGVRTVAVATGTYPRAALAACAPDHLFDSLQEVDQVMDAILG